MQGNNTRHFCVGFHIPGVPRSRDYWGIKVDFWSQCLINWVLFLAAETDDRLLTAAVGWRKISHGFSHLLPAASVYWMRPSGIKGERSAQSQRNLNVLTPPPSINTPRCVVISRPDAMAWFFLSADILPLPAVLTLLVASHGLFVILMCPLVVPTAVRGVLGRAADFTAY